MKKVIKAGLIGIVIVVTVLFVVFLLKGVNFEVLNTKGLLATKEKGLMLFAIFLSLIIVIPVFIFTGYVAWKYRASNTKAKYAPEWDHNNVLEFAWWLIPIILILILSIVTWRSSHELDPYKPLVSDKKPITIQVVALEWKWLFIYPEQDIASMNYAQIPVNVPVNFEITSDAPMNSLWIPQLSGQIYVMTGMTTKLHVIADHIGVYNGYSANLSGKGFADMTFKINASTEVDYNTWISEAKNSDNNLTMQKYNDITKPTQGFPVTYYYPVKNGLFDDIIMKYMPYDMHMDNSDSMGGHL